MQGKLQTEQYYRTWLNYPARAFLFKKTVLFSIAMYTKQPQHYEHWQMMWKRMILLQWLLRLDIITNEGPWVFSVLAVNFLDAGKWAMIDFFFCILLFVYLHLQTISRIRRIVEIKNAMKKHLSDFDKSHIALVIEAPKLQLLWVLLLCNVQYLPDAKQGKSSVRMCLSKDRGKGISQVPGLVLNATAHI